MYNNLVYPTNVIDIGSLKLTGGLRRTLFKKMQAIAAIKLSDNNMAPYLLASAVVCFPTFELFRVLGDIAASTLSIS
jgi:hypothetical protein